MAVFTKQNQITTPSPSPCSSKPSILFIKIMSKTRTWAFLYITIYSILLSFSWNLLKSTLSWYESSVSSSSSNSTGWPAIYASVGLGVIFGVLAVAAALAVVVPVTLMTWISAVVLMSFCGMSRKVLVVEGKKLSGEISGVVVKVLIKEGNLVAGVCGVLGYFVLSRNFKDERL